MRGLVLGLSAACIGVSSGAARAESPPLFATDAGRVEVELEVLAVPWDAGAEFDELDPQVLFGLAGGGYIGDGLKLEAIVRADISDPEADHLEVAAALGWTVIGATEFSIPPAWRLGARAEFGWRWLELVGSDFVVNDDGPLGALSLEVGLVPFEAFSIVARAGVALVSGSNGAMPELQVQPRFGVAFIGVF